MYAGAFGGGLFGTLVVWLTAVLPRINISDDLMNTVICITTLLACPTMYYMYWQLVTLDPGYLALPDERMQLYPYILALDGL